MDANKYFFDSIRVTESYTAWFHDGFHPLLRVMILLRYCVCFFVL